MTSKIREAYKYMMEHQGEYEELTTREMDDLALRLEFMSLDRLKGIEFDEKFNQDTQ